MGDVWGLSGGIMRVGRGRWGSWIRGAGGWFVGQVRFRVLLVSGGYPVRGRWGG